MYVCKYIICILIMYVCMLLYVCVPVIVVCCIGFVVCMYVFSLQCGRTASPSTGVKINQSIKHQSIYIQTAGM